MALQLGDKKNKGFWDRMILAQNERKSFLSLLPFPLLPHKSPQDLLEVVRILFVSCPTSTINLQASTSIVDLFCTLVHESLPSIANLLHHFVLELTLPPLMLPPLWTLATLCLNKCPLRCNDLWFLSILLKVDRLSPLVQQSLVVFYPPSHLHLANCIAKDQASDIIMINCCTR